VQAQLSSIFQPRRCMTLENKKVPPRLGYVNRL
jgi:hypothetical protein